MKRPILLALSLLLSFFATAQPKGGRGPEMQAKIKEAKKKFLTEQLALEDGKADAFWKIYDAFDAEKKANRDQIQAIKRGFSAKSDAQLTLDIDKFFALREQDLAIDKKYYKRFQEVLTLRQIAALYQSEQKFKKFLLEKIQERRGGGPGGPPDFDDED